ncbi:hypothetical protein SO694_00178043 [Aureococcus anophagefferens]|uniref:Sulfotransferase n=1 Tax=Aureococcus anophagefferens TaxID=44056 RepID=A0ABR1FZF8_AURAN
MPRCVAVLLAVVAVAEDASHLLAPSVRRPFVFYHIDKTAGSSLRAIISDAAARARLPAVIPCYGGVTCLCGSNYRVEPFLCPAADAFEAAAVVAGHFSPLGLSKRRVSNMDERTCLVFLREPVARHASFYRFYGHQKYFGNRSFGALSADEQRAAIARSGGPAFMAEFLACDGERCPANVTRAATLALRRCYVGTAERFNSSMAFLSLAAPWLGTYAALSRTHANRAAGGGAGPEPARAAALAAAMPEDSALYGAAAAMLEAQLEAASRCGEGALGGRGATRRRRGPRRRAPARARARAEAAWNHVNVHGVPSPKGPPAGARASSPRPRPGALAHAAGRGTCLTPGRGDDKARDAAIARLRELAFVGVVERWAESICLFHLQFGAPCLAVEFEHLRSQPHNRTVPRAARNVDDDVYAEARRLFAAALDRHGATPERCAALWAPAIHTAVT